MQSVLDLAVDVAPRGRVGVAVSHNAARAAVSRLKGPGFSEVRDELACASVLGLRGEHVFDNGDVGSRSAVETVLAGLDGRQEGKE